MNRRSFFKVSAGSIAAAGLACQSTQSSNQEGGEPLKLGLMTYNLAKDWDIETIIKNCSDTGFEHVELRTTHAHGVEISLSKQERLEVKKRFEDSPLTAISLASAFRYHFTDKKELAENIEGTKEYILLARDIGALGIRVFPNELLTEQGVEEQVTIAQIGKALAKVGEFGYQNGVDVWVCIHGKGTHRVPVIKKIIDAADSPHVWVNWNCNPEDVEGDGLEANFNLVKDRIRGVHMHELWVDYPYRHFFKLLNESGYQGYCNAEIPASPEPIRLMHYYRTAFQALQNVI